MAIPRYTIAPDYSISRIIKGGWHLAGGHGTIDAKQAITDMLAFVEAGITTFDCADIYTGVEELIGAFLKEYRPARASGELPEVQIHTKYVPDYDALPTLSREDTVAVIDRSLRRLGVDRLDLVQFAWWDFSIPGYLEAAHDLQRLVEAGKIRFLGLTNFDASHVRECLDAGISLISNQIQYSVLDQRPAHDQLPGRSLPLLCYGAVAGGFLSEAYLGRRESEWDRSNRSLIKYRLIIDEFGGYDRFQELLRQLADICRNHEASISQVAMRYLLDTPRVAALIVGARNTRHLDALVALDRIALSTAESNQIRAFVRESPGPRGPVYGLERDKNGPHGRIMRYNLNEQRA
jgi:aryl-alcohol dehydrogenase-like predicted oxidoreductase